MHEHNKSLSVSYHFIWETFEIENLTIWNFVVYLNNNYKIKNSHNKDLTILLALLDRFRIKLYHGLDIRLTLYFKFNFYNFIWRFSRNTWLHRLDGFEYWHKNFILCRNFLKKNVNHRYYDILGFFNRSTTKVNR